MRAFPLTVPELLDALEELHPEPTPRPGDASDKLMFDAGRRSVVRELYEWRDRAIAPALRQKRGLGRVSRKDA